jgi:hypothetical protein
VALTDPEIQDIVNRVIEALHQLAPLPPSEPTGLMLIPVFAPVAALLAAVLVTWVGWRNLKHQQKALGVSVRNDDRSEWWKRAQWALEAAMTVENAQLSAAGNEMLRVLVTSDMASDKDKDLLDTVWKAGTGAVSQESAVDAIAEAAAFTYELARQAAADMDDSPETSENDEMKEADNV